MSDLASRLSALGEQIDAAESALHALRAERNEVCRQIESQRLDALIKALPPETLEALQQPHPRPQDMRRLVPRGLAYVGAFDRFWTDKGRAIRSRMGVSNA